MGACSAQQQQLQDETKEAKETHDGIAQAAAHVPLKVCQSTRCPFLAAMGLHELPG